jgi:hypothetical protein
MTALLQFNTWLTGTTLGWAVRGGVPWIWPLCETLHFMGMALLVGIVGVLDLRLLGLARGLPVSPLSKLLPWGLAGFALNLVTGFLFYAGAPEQYMGNGDDVLPNQAFELKLLFIVPRASMWWCSTRRQGSIARWNRSKRDRTHPSPRNSSAARRCLWIGVMARGRMRRSSAAHSGHFSVRCQPRPLGVWPPNGSHPRAADGSRRQRDRQHLC